MLVCKRPDACRDTTGLKDTNPDAEAASNKCELIVAELKPGQAITVWGDLRAAEPHNASTLTAVVAWQTADKMGSQIAVNLGACAVTDWPEKVGAGIWEFLKDITLPLVLLILGWRFQVWDKKRESDRQEAEKKLDEGRQKQEKERAQMVEQWSIMLPDSRKLSRMYYLPLLSAVQQATGYLEKIVKSCEELQKSQHIATKQAQEALLDEITPTAFFYWILSWRQLRNVADCVGGLHFKDRVGEKLTAWSEGKYIELYLGDNRDLLRTYARILDHIDIHEKLDSFWKKFQESKDPKTGDPLGLGHGWDHFKVWVRKPECADSVLYLKAFAALVEYETNRPFQYWYGGVKERINLDPTAEKALVDLAQEIAKQRPELGAFPQKVKDYLAEAKA